MSLVFVLAGIILLCGALCMTELLVNIWERADRRRRAHVRPVVYLSEVRAARPAPVSAAARGCLPDRESIGKICSLSDHFADRFCEVVNS